MIKKNNPQQPKTISISHKFARNSIFNVAGFVVTFPILILLTPYMLRVLGNAQFGIWAIAGVVTSYAQLSDLGMTTAIVKFVAEHWENKETDKISSVVSTVFFPFAFVGGAFTGGILLARHSIVVNILKVPPDMQSEAIFVISGVVVIFYFNLLFSVYNSILLGLQRMDVTNAIMAISKLFRAIGMWFFLATGFGLKGLIWNGAIFSALTIGANVFWALRLTKGLKVNPFLFSFAELRRVIKYSVNIFFATLMGLGQDPLNKIILASFTSLSFVSFYEIGNRVKDILRQLFQVGLMPLLPASSELRSSSISNKHELERIYLSTSRMLYFFAIPAFLLVIVLAEPLVQVWLGDGYTFAARAIQFLMLGNLFSLLITPQYIILNGVGKPQLSTLVSAVNGFVNIVTALILVRLMGYYGVLLAILLSLFSSSILMVYLFHRATGYSFSKYIQALPFKLLAIMFVLTGGAWLISIKINNWRSIFVIAIIFSISYLVVLIRLLNEDEKKLIKKLRFAVLNSINTTRR